MTDQMKVSRQEELLYGPYAGVIRRLGRATTELQDATAELQRLYAESADADQVTAPAPTESAHTRWLIECLNGLYPTAAGVLERYQEMATQAQREVRRRWDPQQSEDMA